MKYRTIKWLDHESNSSWQSEKEIKEWVDKMKPCISKGFVVYEDKDKIVLSASFDGEESYGDSICILKICIVK